MKLAFFVLALTGVKLYLITLLCRNFEKEMVAMIVVKEVMLHHDPCGLAYLVIIGSICLYIPWMQHQEIDFLFRQ